MTAFEQALPPHPLTESFRSSAEHTASAVAGIRIRPLSTMAECHACVGLQQEVWGWDKTDVVPSTFLHVVDFVGGLLAGAFDADEVLQGFVFGVSGMRDGELVHWSHMLGVRESARNVGVGRMLKEYQRTTLAERGVKHIYWTFDPLMAKNAHLNLNRLGARLVEYVPDMYGVSASPLHLGLATDRLIVCVDTSASGDHSLPTADHAESAVLTPYPQPRDHVIDHRVQSPRLILIEMPGNVLEVIQRSSVEAASWRLAVRDHLMWALQHGYAACGVHRDRASDRSFYIMVREALAGSG
jgi:predicted GNAT superfamily acetyltransferase